MNYADLFRATLPETALEVAALLVLVVDLGFLRKAATKTRIAVAALVGIAGCAAAIWAVYATGRYGCGICGSQLLVAWGRAPAAQIAILVLTGLTLLLLIDSEFTRNPGEYVAVVLMAAAGGLIISAAQDLLVIFVGLELLSLGLYILTAFAKKSEKSAEAAMKYYLFGGMSAAFLLFGFSYFYGLSGSTSLTRNSGAVISLSATANAALLSCAGHDRRRARLQGRRGPVPSLGAGHLRRRARSRGSVHRVGLKSRQLRIAHLHQLAILWWPAMLHCRRPRHRIGLPRGPAPALRSRLLHHLADDPDGSSVLSMIFGNLAALAQSSVRRLLAYSAIAHAGYILLGLAFFSWSNASAQSILYYIVTYGLTTIGAFGVVGVVERATGSDKLDSFLGLHKRNPLLAAVLLVLFLSLAGIPPLVGFWAKFNLFAAVLRRFSAGALPFTLVALAIAFSAVSLYYYLQVLKRAYVMPAADETPIHAHPVTLAVLLLIAAAVVVLGCFPALLQSWIASFYA